MKSLQVLAGTFAAMVASTGTAFAAGGPFNVPEPGSLLLVGVAVAALVAVSRKNKK